VCRALCSYILRSSAIEKNCTCIMYGIAFCLWKGLSIEEGRHSRDWIFLSSLSLSVRIMSPDGDVNYFYKQLKPHLNPGLCFSVSISSSADAHVASFVLFSSLFLTQPRCIFLRRLVENTHIPSHHQETSWGIWMCAQL